MYVSVKKCLGKRTCEFSAVALKIFFPRVSSLERNVIILGIKMCPHLHSSQRSFSQASSAVGILESYFYAAHVILLLWALIPSFTLESIFA